MLIEVFILIVVALFIFGCFLFIRFLYFNFKALQNVKADKGMVINLLPFLALSKSSFNAEGKIFYEKSWKSFFYFIIVLIILIIGYFALKSMASNN